MCDLLQSSVSPIHRAGFSSRECRLIDADGVEFYVCVPFIVVQDPHNAALIDAHFV